MRGPKKSDVRLDWRLELFFMAHVWKQVFITARKDFKKIPNFSSRLSRQFLKLITRPMPNPRDDSFVQTFYSDHKYSSITETSYNYVASTISVALIGLPFALSDLNLLIGSFVIGLTILSCNFTSKILILLSDTYKVYSIEDLTDIAFGKVCAIFILVIQLIFSITTISLTLRELSMTILSVSERSERALWKTSILALTPP